VPAGANCGFDIFCDVLRGGEVRKCRSKFVQAVRPCKPNGGNSGNGT
jgi:hypothetical protein